MIMETMERVNKVYPIANLRWSLLHTADISDDTLNRLKAMGAGAGSIGAVFLVAGMLIGVVGTVAGSAFGLLLIWVQNTYKIIRLAGDVYQISYLPMKLTGSDFTMIVGATLIISFLATISPARRAARMDPVDVLRYE